MSQSLRHTARHGNTTARSEKWDKRFANRKLRLAVSNAIRREDETMPALREISNIFAFAKDGKRWRPEWLSWQWRNR